MTVTSAAGAPRRVLVEHVAVAAGISDLAKTFHNHFVRALQSEKPGLAAHPSR